MAAETDTSQALRYAIDAALALDRAKRLMHIPAPHGCWGRTRVADLFEQEIRVSARNLDGSEKAKLMQLLNQLHISVKGL